VSFESRKKKIPDLSLPPCIISYALILLALCPRNSNRKHHTFSFPPLKSRHSQSPLAAIKDFLSEIRFYYILPSKFFGLTVWQKLMLHSGRDGKEKVSKFLSKFDLCGQCGGAVRDSFRISGLHTLNFSLPKRLVLFRGLYIYPIYCSLHPTLILQNTQKSFCQPRSWCIFHFPSPSKLHNSLKIYTLHFPTAASTCFTNLTTSPASLQHNLLA
jgi:hypothetical protein